MMENNQDVKPHPLSLRVMWIQLEEEFKDVAYRQFDDILPEIDLMCHIIVSCGMEWYKNPEREEEYLQSTVFEADCARIGLNYVSVRKLILLGIHQPKALIYLLHNRKTGG
jgi:hypothetical protein